MMGRHRGRELQLAPPCCTSTTIRARGEIGRAPRSWKALSDVPLPLVFLKSLPTFIPPPAQPEDSFFAGWLSALPRAAIHIPAVRPPRVNLR
jgi:hypothetical protein